MAEVHVQAERVISAPLDRVYRILSDYQNHHPRILPNAFSNFRVEKGGVGEGTEIRYRFRAGNRERDYHMRVSEPDPGSVLAEHDLHSSLLTTFRLTPDGSGTRVVIDTRWQGTAGIGGFFERTFAPRLLRRVYDDELNRLEEYAQQVQ